MAARNEELEALSLLKKHFSKYQDLELADKPDLIDEQNSIGVEITMALNPGVEECEKYFKKHLENHDRKEVRTEQIERFEQYGLDIVSTNDTWEDDAGKMLGLIRVFGNEELELLHKAIRKKYAKKYAKLEEIDLYIFFRHVCGACLNASEIERLFCTAYMCQEENGAIFKNIMIDFYSTMVILDLKNHEYREIPYEGVG